jgi:prepilin-type N-terminal cleavage/methylation domain-containing protein
MKKGFTLIELLAVILILGIIALIAIPTVNNILEEARMGAFKTSVNQVAKSAEQNCQLQQLRNENITGNINFTNGEPSINLEYKGDGPDAGYMNVTNDCGVTFAVADTRYCAVKETVEDEIKIGKLENGVCKINEIEYSLENVNYTPEECFVFDSSTGTIKEYLCGMKYNSSTSSYEAAANYYPDVVIPKTINGVQVKKIGDNAFCTWYVGASNGFSDNYIYSKINSIVFPNTLISIGEEAFANNSISYFNLFYIVLPQGLLNRDGSVCPHIKLGTDCSAS